MLTQEQLTMMAENVARIRENMAGGGRGGGPPPPRSTFVLNRKMTYTS